MKPERFKHLFDRFQETTRAFSEEDWDNAVKAWDEYYQLIKKGLPLKRWIKNEQEGYLPDFLDTKEQRFGHARIGNYEQVMIYKYTGTDKKRENKYRSVYQSPDAYKCFDNESDIEDDYNQNIKPLISSIVNADSLDAIYKIEKSEAYDRFVCKQILRKITILNSVRPDSKYKNEFMWIFNDKALNILSDILEVDFGKEKKTFLEKNKAIYDKAKEYAGITKQSKKAEYIKLYDFLWYLSDSSYSIPELSDFNSINVIFNGAPGTGKTYGVRQGIDHLRRIDDSLFKEPCYIQFHPSYTYQDFIEGIKPLGIEAGSLNLQVVNGSFKKFCIKVRKENEQFYNSLKKKPDIERFDDFEDWPHYYFVVDEINRGNLSNIFGETFTLLEKGYRDYDFSGNYSVNEENHLIVTPLESVISRLDNNEDLIYKIIDGVIYFGIPFNIHFIGMMNDVDRSIDSFDLAFRRRFKWIAKYCDYDVIRDTLVLNGYPSDDIDEYVSHCKALNDFICDDSQGGLHLGRNYEIGHSFYLEILNYGGQNRVTKAKKEKLFDNYIAGTLKEYIRQVADDNEIDGWISKAKKVFDV